MAWLSRNSDESPREQSDSDAAAEKAVKLFEIQQSLPPRLEQQGHPAAAEKVRTEGGRWDSHETRANRESPER